MGGLLCMRPILLLKCNFCKGTGCGPTIPPLAVRHALYDIHEDSFRAKTLHSSTSKVMNIIKQPQQLPVWSPSQANRLAVKALSALSALSKIFPSLALVRLMLWKHYVNDTCCIAKKGSLEVLLEHLNSMRLTIQ